MWTSVPHGSGDVGRATTARAGPYLLTIIEASDGSVRWQVDEVAANERHRTTGLAADVIAAKRAAVAEARRRVEATLELVSTFERELSRLGGESATSLEDADEGAERDPEAPST